MALFFGYGFYALLDSNLILELKFRSKIDFYKCIGGLEVGQ